MYQTKALSSFRVTAKKLVGVFAFLKINLNIDFVLILDRDYHYFNEKNPKRNNGSLRNYQVGKFF